MLSKEEAEEKAKIILQDAKQASNTHLAKRVKNIPRRFRVAELKPLAAHDQVRLFERAKMLASEHPSYKKINYIFIMIILWIAIILMRKMAFFVQQDTYNIALYLVLSSFVLFSIYRDALIKKYLLALIQED